MNIIPIVFAFDNRIVLPAAVCISSLLSNAKPDTFYHIFILHSRQVNLNKEGLEKLASTYKNCSIEYREVGDTFDTAYEVRGVTKATYYRLLIPSLIAEYDKIIYSDVDIIFRMDLWDVYSQDISNYYLAATLDLGLNQKESYLYKIGVEVGKYIQAGFLILNLASMRNANIENRFVEHIKHKYTYQDQDILNICCKDRIKYLPQCYNVNDCALIYMLWQKDSLPISIDEQTINYALNSGNIHYSGYKPWKRYSMAFDIWWEYYRKSPVYDVNEYHKFFFDKTMLLDSLSLFKRIKILFRYFIYGRYKG